MHVLVHDMAHEILHEIERLIFTWVNKPVTILFRAKPVTNLFRAKHQVRACTGSRKCHGLGRDISNMTHADEALSTQISQRFNSSLKRCYIFLQCMNVLYVCALPYECMCFPNLYTKLFFFLKKWSCAHILSVHDVPVVPL